MSAALPSCTQQNNRRRGTGQSYKAREAGAGNVMDHCEKVELNGMGETHFSELFFGLCSTRLLLEERCITSINALFSY